MYGFRYIRLNVQCLDTARKYNENVPSFLRNRPRNFVQHCIQRLPPCVSHIESSDIVGDGSGSFSVKSADSGKIYSVVICSGSEPLPNCSCPDWAERHLPCKHMLAVMTTFPLWGWQSLPEAYRTFPHFHLDPDIVPVDANCSVVDTVIPIQHSSKYLISTLQSLLVHYCYRAE